MHAPIDKSMHFTWTDQKMPSVADQWRRHKNP